MIGHSLGALLAAPERLDLDVVLRQLNYLKSLPGTPQEAVTTAIHQAEAARAMLARADLSHPPAGTFFHAPASWWRILAHGDAIDTARRLHAPLPVLQGMSDFQVPPTRDFAAWQHAFHRDARVTLRSYAGLSHLFMLAGGPCTRRAGAGIGGRRHRGADRDRAAIRPRRTAERQPAARGG